MCGLGWQVAAIVAALDADASGHIDVDEVALTHTAYSVHINHVSAVMFNCTLLWT